jgi:hypothetical protein
MAMHVSDQDLVSTLSGQISDAPLLGAVYARFDTSLSFARWLTPLGNYYIARPAARNEAQKISNDTGVPLDGAVVFGVSKNELHIWSADPMLSNVDDYLGAVPRSEIKSVTTSPGKSWQKLQFALENGHTIDVEARGGVHAFVSAFEG